MLAGDDKDLSSTVSECCSLANLCERCGDLEGAARAYAQALSLDPELRPARRGLAIILARLGRREQCSELCRQELEADDGEQWLGDQIVNAMTHVDLSLAGELAAILVALQRGSEWYPPAPRHRAPRLDGLLLSVPKLQHDLDQLRYLQDRRVLDARFDDILAGHAEVLARHAHLGDNARTPLTDEDVRAIGQVYGRLVHVTNAPRVGAALSTSWDRQAAERIYREQRPAIVVIDNFLTSEALAHLERFCLESTIWFSNRYAHGRLGSLFFTGFNCPLLLQIAAELRVAFPWLIGDRYPLRQLWGFKYTRPLPGDSTVHADFAAVNVNFWITPTEANLDSASGGMVIYDVDAPASWNFARYNERADLIKEFLTQRRARAIRIPYRQNRAVIFNSDLFHATEAVHFRPDYASHRINITMLYGERSLDQESPPLHAPDSLTPAWRSAAFSRARR